MYTRLMHCRISWTSAASPGSNSFIHTTWRMGHWVHSSLRCRRPTLRRPCKWRMQSLGASAVGSSAPRSIGAGIGSMLHYWLRSRVRFRMPIGTTPLKLKSIPSPRCVSSRSCGWRWIRHLRGHAGAWDSPWRWLGPCCSTRPMPSSPFHWLSARGQICVLEGLHAAAG